MSKVNYIIGGLFPKKANGELNLILSDGLYIDANNRVSASSVDLDKGDLNTKLDITTNNIRIPGMDNFLKNWLVPQITNTKATTFKKGVISGGTLFGSIAAGAIGNWSKQARNRTMSTLVKLGYIGPGSDNDATNNAFWNANGTKSDELDGQNLYDAINNVDNYNPSALWGTYNGSIELESNFDTDSLLANLHGGMHEEGMDMPDLWYPSLLYSYSEKGQGTSFPGPVLMLRPGNDLNIDFNNKLTIPGLTVEQAQKATLIQNSTYGNTASDGLGGTTSVNYHFHGSHTNSTGFGDNVVSRYTTGQEWTTHIQLPEDHGQGSYWYHPHYHPSVNQQVYGGLSGFIQIGDPLSKIPDFKDIPRNLAVMKQVGIGIDSSTGNPLLSGFDHGSGNTPYMVTVNGEFQPTADAGKGGWQSITLSNQSNKDFYNIGLKNQASDGSWVDLPLYIYGEDGHQYPQIKAAKGTLGRYDTKAVDGSTTSIYSQADNILSLAPAKRLDVLVYLPEGTSQLVSHPTKNTFTKDGKQYSIQNTAGFPDLSETAQGLTSAGPLAYFEVNDGTPALSTNELNSQINTANKGIDIQNIQPTTKESDYDSSKIPSVNLFADQWDPIRKREYNWSKAVLVGPEDEQDAATQAAIKDYEAANPGKTIERYHQLPVITAFNQATKPTAGIENWLGYDNPFLINDHVFPNGSLTIAQLGTIEEWRLRNWSIGPNGPTKYIGHPFHIHINDYQTKDSDTELINKNVLEDVTMVNSSGYKAYNNKTGLIDQADPFRGEFHSIEEATSPELIESKGIGYNKNGYADLGTWGANDQTVRMLFQDYIGTYVFHCHILPHEDAGMMQVVTVVENTDSSWLVPAEGFNITSDLDSFDQNRNIEIRLAQDLSTRYLNPELGISENAVRMQVGDLSDDFVQDVVLTTSSKATGGEVRVYDGSSLLDGKTKELSSIKPYEASIAPWAFVEDFTGDGRRELFTAGFDKEKKDGTININDLKVNGWASANNDGKGWKDVFDFSPFESIEKDVQHGGHHYEVSEDISSDQVSVAIADMNLDNFQDVIVAYKVKVSEGEHKSHTNSKDGLRVVVLDGAALSLNYQTGKMEGGYLPDSNVLADALFLDSSLSDLSNLVLTAGFNSYAQSALENIVITAQSGSKSQQFTLQLQAGHFLATSEPDAHGGHGGHGGSQTQDDRIINLRNDSMPLYLVEELDLPDETVTANPVLTGGLGNGALLSGDYLMIAQGNSANGNHSSSDRGINTTQQLVINLPGLLEVNDLDLIGATDSNLSSTFKGKQVEQRGNLANLTYLAYAGTSLWPSHQASLSAGILGKGGTAEELAESILLGYSSDIIDYYGEDLDGLSTKDVVTGATESLYGRKAEKSEIKHWNKEVKDGLDKSLIPLRILQTTSGIDLYRVAFLSAGSQWSQFQWATNDNVEGSFGQGLQGDSSGFNNLSNAMMSVGEIASWDDAQKEYDAYRESFLTAFVGSTVEKSGFF
ncbi:multicopper oxidase family protein [Prochlorococcus marinus]|uniref:Plastocyanin-like domain-containing protein n=1 Tax=Prochlorococcus marinus (strain MIT 9303) TaxID=59922 RepID=A2CBF6_PROM3|nr:multicopper oxidase domain-containing protein [Prochlorococcus marinus]ABM78816.1 Hypothetical protein P9303_20801 [Prochlorococcus marinus str. MIT 9303]